MAPPQLNTNIVVSHKFRFKCSTAGSYVITSPNVLGAIGTTGLNSAQCAAIADSFRVRSIAMWAPPPSQGTTATVAVEWVGQAYGNSLEFSDTTVSTAQPAYLRSTPPVSSLASFWQNPNGGSTGNLLTVTAPVSTLIDLVVDFILIDTAAAGYYFATASASDGIISYLALDGYASNKITPVGLNSHV
jgi:hypothetical protein